VCFGWVGEAGYVGSRGMRIRLGLKFNAGPVGGGTDGRLLNANPSV